MKNLITCLVVCVLSSVVASQTPVYEDFKLLASDGENSDYFGYSVSISSDGTTAIVGAIGYYSGISGFVYIYELVNGVWEETKLLASDGASDDRFGGSVSISSDGTVAIVGAYTDGDNGTSSGSAYIYSLVNGVWEETKLLASDGASSDYFGYSVSISSDGTTAIVGAFRDDDNGTDSGSVYIYELVNGVWEETKLLASDGASDDRFGGSVSISSDGTSAIVGAYYDDDNGGDSGSAYIYELVKGVWEETKLLASDGASGDNFGSSVSISSDGTVAIVGAYYDYENSMWCGSAYIYSLANGVWEETKLLASDGASADRFGRIVSISSDGTVAIVGAYYDDDNGRDSGSAYIYELVKGVWEETKLLASDGAHLDYFGRSVSISFDGTTAIVGAHQDDDSDWESGSAYIFYNPGDTDGDGVTDDIDNCYLYNPDQADCNGNEVGDVCDIAGGTSDDINDNDIPDDCEDSDGDGVPDDMDNCYLYNPNQADCNTNEIGDVCDIADGTSNDINDNGIPDECEDSDGDGIPDDMDAFPNDPNEWADSDGDGMGDNEDLATLGACCVDSGCDLLAQVTCNSLGGSWLGAKGGGCANCPTICSGDINGDGVVDVSDLLAIIAVWGVCP